ncbi:hypothetical protein QIS74_08718 [Colletotrichum tabaci]|uniref:Uncharacterized protein n=1 Tax=Colletotrichum tabaci TaxID=1209068 RepID=A0AAV9TCC9_9PEZI
MTLASSPVDSSPPFFAPDLEGLAQAPAPVARAILVALCDDRRVRAQALRQLGRLLRFEADVRGRDPVVGSPDSPATSPSNPRKRKATGEPKICVQCDCIFTDNENTFGACWYHTDKLELWDETQIPTLWDEVTSDELDTESNRAEYPAAFRWCCCERLGDRPGCVRGEHEANPDRSKKGRGNELSDPEDDPLELDGSGDLELDLPTPHQQHYTITNSQEGIRKLPTHQHHEQHQHQQLRQQ